MQSDRPESPRRLSSSRRQTIRRPNRLTSSDDFQRARREGNSWTNRYLVLRAVPNSLDRSRLGFAVGKRVGKATVRNRIRRLLREAIRMRLNQIAPGWDLVLIAREPIREADFATVRSMTEQLLQRADLLVQADAESGHAPDNTGLD